MNHRVVWRKRVRNRLGTVLFIAREQGRDTSPIQRAVREIGRRLADAPATEGESRDGSERVLIVGPLAVFFEVFAVRQTVLIYSAVSYPRQRL